MGRERIWRKGQVRQAGSKGDGRRHGNTVWEPETGSNKERTSDRLGDARRRATGGSKKGNISFACRRLPTAGVIVGGSTNLGGRAQQVPEKKRSGGRNERRVRGWAGPARAGSGEPASPWPSHHVTCQALLP